MQKEENRAKKNWQKLRNIIKSQNLTHKNKEKKFNLFVKNKHHLENDIITQYKYLNFIFFQKSPMPVFKQLLHYKNKIDATGKWIWQAQQIGAYFLLNEGIRIVEEQLIRKEKNGFNHKYQANQYLQKSQINEQIDNKKQQSHTNFKILELGSGSSGLASIALAQIIVNNFPHIKLHLQLTDGQQQNIPYLQENIKLNFNLNQSIKAQGYFLLWGDKQSKNQNNQQGKVYDLIIVCDCLYFIEYQQDLVDSIKKSLSENGAAFLINPKRGNSMDDFLKLIHKAGLYSEEIFFKNQKYEVQVSELLKELDFNEDKCMQFFTKITKSKE